MILFTCILYCLRFSATPMRTSVQTHPHRTSTRQVPNFRHSLFFTFHSQQGQRGQLGTRARAARRGDREHRRHSPRPQPSRRKGQPILHQPRVRRRKPGQLIHPPRERARIIMTNPHRPYEWADSCAPRDRPRHRRPRLRLQAPPRTTSIPPSGP